MGRINRTGSSDLSPSIPEVYLRVMIKGVFLRVDAVSDTQHINNPT